MTLFWKRIFAKTAFATLSSLAVTLLIAQGAVAIFGGSVSGVGLLLCILCPVCIAMPASLFQFLQSARLKQARDELLEAHQALDRMHRTLAETHVALERKAKLDSLTSVLNHESFRLSVEQLSDQGRSGTLLFLDIDHFKSVNDTHGHVAGDTALKAMTSAIGAVMRTDDVFGRIGGEEFAIFLTDSDMPEACQIGEEIRRLVAGLRIPVGAGEPLSITISAGAARGGQRFSTATIWAIADERLYEAKRQGRNRVVGDGRISSISIRDAYWNKRSTRRSGIHQRAATDT